MTESAENAPYDVAVLGAGAAGLFAAFRAAERGRRVVLVEKNRRPGVKILMSGGTRCNLTNARGLRRIECVSGPVDPGFDPREMRGIKVIQRGFGEGGAFLGPALKALDVDRTVALFEAEGLATKVEANGKIFPATDRAVDVVDALMRRLRRSGAEFRPDSPVIDVEPSPDGFRVVAEGASILARRVILAVGGTSYPGCGTCGDGYRLARRLGHRIIEPKPALVPIRVDAPWVTDLKGVTIPDAHASVVAPGRSAPIRDRREALLFAHFGLTGPSILDVSGAVARHEGADRLDLALDFLPDQPLDAFDARLQADCRAGRSSVAALLSRSLPRRLADALLFASEIPADRIGPALSRDERRRLVSRIKSLRLPISGTLGFAKAEVTSGGVSLDEIDPKTLESRISPGFHVVGEVLDLDGLIGGYNFQGAWSMGWLAGESV